MRIPCPFCGLRSHEEFTYGGDAGLVRPDPARGDAEAAFADYVYLRTNPMGLHRELWFHGAGCQSWLVLERDTVTHAVGRCFAAVERPPSKADS
jgi:methylglutamate dehydrogenase subunit B